MWSHTTPRLADGLAITNQAVSQAIDQSAERAQQNGAAIDGRVGPAAKYPDRRSKDKGGRDEPKGGTVEQESVDNVRTECSKDSCEPHEARDGVSPETRDAEGHDPRAGVAHHLGKLTLLAEADDDAVGSCRLCVAHELDDLALRPPATKGTDDEDHPDRALGAATGLRFPSCCRYSCPPTLQRPDEGAL